MGIRKVRRIDFWPDEWLAGTAELSPYDRGIYITICALIYSRGEWIGIELLARHSGVHGNALNAALKRLALAGKVCLNGAEISQKRCGNELETSRKRLGNAAEKEGESSKVIDLRPLRARASHGQLPTTNLETSPTDKNPPEEVSVAPHGATARAAARTPRERRARKLSPIEGIMKGFADAAAARDSRKLRNGGGDWPPAGALLGE